MREDNVIRSSSPPSHGFSTSCCYSKFPEKKPQMLLTVPPFECEWRREFQFPEAGRGCVVFEAFALNDVTVVFREKVGSRLCHYRRDTSSHYTVIIGSHRNRRLRILVDGEAMADADGTGLCCSPTFQGYWISFCDGLIGIGKGIYPFQDLVFQWLDPNPNCKVRYVGLSSWDKHVGYKDVTVLPLARNHLYLCKNLNFLSFDGDDELQDLCGLGDFLESSELSDMFFVVGIGERLVPGHKVVLEACGRFNFRRFGTDFIYLQWVTYPVFHAFLQYVYTGQAEILESEISSLRSLSSYFEVVPLMNYCDELIDGDTHFTGSSKVVRIPYPDSHRSEFANFPDSDPLKGMRLKELYLSHLYADVLICIDDYELLLESHKIILSMWSLPFKKMFTNGMAESRSSHIYLKDVHPEAFSAMLECMYMGFKTLHNDNVDLLLQILILSDRFGVSLLHQECCKKILECLSEETVLPIHKVVSSFTSCKLIEEACKRKYAMHFDYCTRACADFILLDNEIFSSILRHPCLAVESEEGVMDAILRWCTHEKAMHGWQMLDSFLEYSTPEQVFGDRIESLSELIPMVRFPLMHHTLLEKLQKSNLSKKIPLFYNLVREAIDHLSFGSIRMENNVRFQHRQSSYKELQYICDGDKNGVLYFSGTSYGKHPWINPVLSKRIIISASSPISRFTDPKALASRMYQGTSFAGPGVEDGNKHAWWMVDLGEDHQLVCNYYTVRQDGSRAYLRHWSLQAWVDGWGAVDGFKGSLRGYDDGQCGSVRFVAGQWTDFPPVQILPPHTNRAHF